MKILHIITRLILGGAQENTILSCEGQARDGHDVTLAYGPIYGPEGSLFERAKRGGYALIELPDLMRPIRPMDDWRCYRELRRLIHDLKPDVVHTHSSKAGILGRAAAWAEHVPAVIHTVHGLPFHPYQNPVIHKGYVWAERWAARRCHTIACVADAMVRQAVMEGVGARKQFEVVYSGMETAPFLKDAGRRDETRRALGLADRHVAIGTLARLAELKGHDDLLDGLAVQLKSRPDWRLVWIGDGWWRPRLEKKIETLGLTGRVIFTGLIEPDRVPDMLRALDVLVHPSYREGLARALPQALLCGVPVVSYDGDGAGEVCIDGRTGRLVPTGNIEALADATAWMIDHPKQAATMTAEGKALCTERFDAQNMVRALEALYRRILDSRSP